MPLSASPDSEDIVFVYSLTRGQRPHLPTYRRCDNDSIMSVNDYLR